MVLARFTWPKIGQNIKLWRKECLQCQQNKNSRRSKLKTCQIDDGITRFSHVQLDNAGPLSSVPDSPHGYSVTFVNRVTKWFEAEPLSSTKPYVICDAILNSESSRFGITTERGFQFESKLFEYLAKILFSVC